MGATTSPDASTFLVWFPCENIARWQLTRGWRAFRRTARTQRLRVQCASAGRLSPSRLARPAASVYRVQRASAGCFRNVLRTTEHGVNNFRRVPFSWVTSRARKKGDKKRMCHGRDTYAPVSPHYIFYRLTVPFKWVIDYLAIAPTITLKAIDPAQSASSLENGARCSATRPGHLREKKCLRCTRRHIVD